MHTEEEMKDNSKRQAATHGMSQKRAAGSLVGSSLTVSFLSHGTVFPWLVFITEFIVWSISTWIFNFIMIYMEWCHHFKKIFI
jgi:hypothetical protein